MDSIFEKAILSIFSEKEDSFVLMDLQGIILKTNNVFQKKCGKSDENLIGTRIWDNLPANFVSNYRSIIAEVIQTKNTIRFFERAGEKWNEISVSLIQESGNNEPLVLYFSRDVTGQVEAEEKLKKVTMRLVTIQEDERRRISQDLHDDIGQRMTGLMLNLRSINNALPVDNDQIKIQLKSCISELETTIKQLRQISYQLFPTSLNKMALDKVLRAFCTSFFEMTGLRIDFSSQEDIPTVSNAYATAIYRMIQEGLVNAVKHANATSAWVNLDGLEDEISVSLEDNGNGFDVSTAHAGMGLVGIKERFLLLNGNFEIDSAIGKGTRLVGSLPIPDERM